MIGANESTRIHVDKSTRLRFELVFQPAKQELPDLKMGWFTFDHLSAANGTDELPVPYLIDVRAAVVASPIHRNDRRVTEAAREVRGAGMGEMMVDEFHRAVESPAIAQPFLHGFSTTGTQPRLETVICALHEGLRTSKPGHYRRDVQQ